MHMATRSNYMAEENSSTKLPAVEISRYTTATCTYLHIKLFGCAYVPCMYVYALQCACTYAGVLKEVTIVTLHNRSRDRFGVHHA